MYDLILFDLDGTLVDTAPDIADAVNGVLADRGLPRVAESWVRNHIGHGSRRLFELAVPPTGDATPPLEQLLDEFAEHYAYCCGRRGRLYPEVATTLSSLRNAGIKLALLTNKERRFARFVLEVHGLDGNFDVEVCGDTLPVRKPDAGVVIHCLDTLNLAREQALLVGDSEIDVQTARNAGIAVWAVDYGYNQGRPVTQCRPDRVIAMMAEVLEPFAEKLAAAAGGAPAVPGGATGTLYFRSE